MTGQFSFSFAGDDIEDDGQSDPSPAPALPVVSNPVPTAPAAPAGASAFPVQGKPLLAPAHHDLDHMLSSMPSKIAYGLMTVDLDDGSTVQLPRRELWDVRLQLMADEENEEGSEAASGLGDHDVKTGIYEGGFKSWESSVDLVKVLASENTAHILSRDPCVSIELGCGTALPSLAVFQWALAERQSSGEKLPMVLTLADYNPSVLYLVALPNFLLAWALQQRGKTPVLDEALCVDGELELTEEVVRAFKASLSSNHISLSFLSGAWSPEFVELLYRLAPATPATPAGSAARINTLVLGSETIYSPFALESFASTLLSILERERESSPEGKAMALIAAKRLYFGVGGSLDDFIARMRDFGVAVETLREETDGVRRGVVRCLLP